MGRKVPRPMVSPGNALSHRAHEEDRPLNARASRVDPQLFPRSEVAFQRRRRGSEQQSQSHHEKILRIPHLPLPRTRTLSLTWQTARARINPRFLLTNPELGAREELANGGDEGGDSVAEFLFRFLGACGFCSD